MSPQAFAYFALSEVAYIKRVGDDEETRYAIHAADGTCLGIANDRATALAAIRQQDMEPLTLQ
jgi:hypothetical protein